MFFEIALVAVAAASCVPGPRARIAEILYDAAGDDTGKEFVELYNPFGQTVSLAGARLEVGDGSAAGRWTARWTGGAQDSVPPGGRFVVGGALVDAVPKAVATLELQNGPDAVRLVWPDGAAEVVGYGPLEIAEYFCGEPALDVPSGVALARLPDDADRGANALDFEAAPPSPGRPNQRRRNAALIPGSMSLLPEQPRPGARSALAIACLNRGQFSWTSDEAAVHVSDGADGALLGSRGVPALAAGDTAIVAIDLPGLDAGKRRLLARVILAGDEAAEDDADSLAIRVGPGPLRLMEIQFHPVNGEGEWIEVRNQSAQSLDPGAFELFDRSGGGGSPAGAQPLAPDSLGLLVQSREQLLVRHPRLDSARVWEVRPWPSLNNSDDAGGVADIVALRESDGTLDDALAYSASGVPSGVPLERIDEGVWAPSRSAEGSPLRPPVPSGPVPGRFDVEPRRLASGGPGARLRWDLPWSRARVAFDLYDMAGRERGRVLAETPAAARGEHLWVPDDLRAGVYLLVMRARSEDGRETLASSRAIRIESP